MRLIAWNANYNNNRRSFEATIELLEPLAPDLLVISETAEPVASSTLDSVFVGAAPPGLAIAARPGLQLRAHPLNDGAPPLIAGFEVSGDVELRVLATWPVRRSGDPSYHQLLMNGLDRFSQWLEEGPSIMAGDFNSSAKVLAQRASHPRFVAAARERGLVSAYHQQSGESFGEESVCTYRHKSVRQGDFHIDYCFVSEGLLASANIEVLQDDCWMSVSDHYPLVLDLVDRRT